MSQPLRIGVDACPLVGRRTGVGNYVHDLLSLLVDQRRDARFFLYSNTAISFPASGNVEMRANAGAWRGVLWQNLQLPARLKQDRIDVYWGSNGLAPLKFFTKTPTVVTIHDLADRFAPETQTAFVRWSRRFLQPVSARHAAVVLCNSDATAADVQRIYGVRSRATIRPFFPGNFSRRGPDAIGAIRQKYDLPEEFLLTVGTLEPRKNFVRLIEAARAVRAKGMPLPLLVHAGGSGWLNEDIETLLGAAVADGVVKRLGYAPWDDLPALYSACSAFIMPSIYEGFGMPVLEAQLCGAPVMHGDHASMVEAGGRLGVAFPPTTEGIERALTDYVRGKGQLACRLPSDIRNDPEHAAETLWSALLEGASKK